MVNNLSKIGVAISSNKNKLGSKKVVFGVFLHFIFGVILMLGYIVYLATKIDPLDFTYVPINVGYWFLIDVSPFLIIGSIIIFILLKNKFKFSTILIIGFSIEVVLAAILPLSDELARKKLENYGIAQNNETIEERAAVLPTIKDINGCVALTTYDVWKECIEAHLKTKQDFDSCRIQKWGQFSNATSYHGNVAMAEYFSRQYRDDACQRAYDPIGLSTAKNIEDCFDLGGPAWFQCFKQNMRSESDLVTCKSLASEPSGWGDRGCQCNQVWAEQQKQVTLCNVKSCALSVTYECISNIVNQIDITDVFRQCSGLSNNDLRHQCALSAIIKISNSVELQKKYNSNVAKDLCSLVDESNRYQPTNFCINLKLNNY